MTREEAIKFMKAMKRGLKSTGKDYPYRDEYIPKMKEACGMAIKALEQEPKTGHWIDGVCSECGYIGDEEVFGGKFKYCPNCGAKMVGSQESEVEE